MDEARDRNLLRWVTEEQVYDFIITQHVRTSCQRMQLIREILIYLLVNFYRLEGLQLCLRRYTP